MSGEANPKPTEPGGKKYLSKIGNALCETNEGIHSVTAVGLEQNDRYEWHRRRATSSKETKEEKDPQPPPVRGRRKMKIQYDEANVGEMKKKARSVLFMEDGRQI
ncbi:hypothetical protein RUM43_003600 [Polyplax serrata]|uniref:Uncharacterized protein n=1 Tax=Polyplax serrata TaxID=468196 RepID=A0AAN8S5M6_POLSC